MNRIRILTLLLSAVVLFCGCTAPMSVGPKQYTATFLTLFDTVTTIVGTAESESAFREQAQSIHDTLLVYHQLFDIYHDYDGINNLKTVNDAAGKAPVAVDDAIIALLSDCKQYYELTGGRVNVAMGGVLRLWHDAREDGMSNPASASLPDENALRAAAAHISPDALIIDAAAGTVFLSDPEMSLDVGAVAKGWAAQRAAETAPQGMLISVGGNVCATGPKDANGTPWVVGIQNPDGSSENLHTLNLTSGCVVTSGDYQRLYYVDEVAYHHIIDPDTQYPARYWSSVTVVCEDSGLADALSTALFLLPREAGQELLDACGAAAMWVTADGIRYYSPGFEERIRT